MRSISLCSAITLLALLLYCAPKQQSIQKIPSNEIYYRLATEITEAPEDVRFSDPSSVSLDDQGNLYIVDRGNNRLVKLDNSYSFLKDNSEYGLGLSGLSHPQEIISDAGLGFFVFDQGNNRIVRCDQDLTLSDAIRFTFDPQWQLLGKIASIGYSRFGSFFMSDPDNLKVMILDREFLPEGELMPTGGFSRCGAIFIDEESNCFVYDSELRSIFRFDSLGNSAGKIWLPDAGLISDFIVSEEKIFAVDKEKNQIAVYDLEGSRLIEGDEIMFQISQLKSPSGIALSSDGRLFVCDSGNNRILVFVATSR